MIKKMSITICLLSLMVCISGCVPKHQLQDANQTIEELEAKIAKLESKIEELEAEVVKYEKELAQVDTSANISKEDQQTDLTSETYTKIQDAKVTGLTDLNNEMCRITFTCEVNGEVYTTEFDDYYYLPELELSPDSRVGLRIGDINHDNNDEIILKVYAVGNTFYDRVGSTHVFSFNNGILQEILYIDVDVIDGYWVTDTAIADDNFYFFVDTKLDDMAPQCYIYEFTNNNWVMREHQLTDEQYQKMDWF